MRAWQVLRRQARGAYAAGIAALSMLPGSCPVPAMQQSAAQAISLDEMNDLRAWEALASDGVSATVAPGEGVDDGALMLAFDFGGTAGYAAARRELPTSLPDDYEISFWMRAQAGRNHFEVKFVDASGENVWWFRRANYSFSGKWQQVRIKQRQIQFAWGPTPDRRMRRFHSIELVIAAGADGGAGRLWFDRLELKPRVRPAVLPEPSAQASSQQAGHAAALAIDGNPSTYWRSDASGPSGQRPATHTFELDLYALREFGGLQIDWAPGLHAPRYTIEATSDGRTWQRLRTIEASNGGRDSHLLTESEARRIRLRIPDPGRDVGIAELHVRGLEFGASPNAFVRALAQGARRGCYPRGFLQEQSYWTIVGLDGGAQESLLSEDGALEPRKSSYSIEPFVRTKSGWLTWADVRIEQSLAEGYLPIPSVHWRHPEVGLTITAYTGGKRGAELTRVIYRVSNPGQHALQATLALVVRPFQVNAPEQFLNIEGGVSPIRKMAFERGHVQVDGRPGVFPRTAPQAFRAVTGEADTPCEWLPSALGSSSVQDESGFAAGALLYEITLDARASREIVLDLPLAEQVNLPPGDPPPLSQVAQGWRERLNRVELRLPALPLSGKGASDGTGQASTSQASTSEDGREGSKPEDRSGSDRAEADRRKSDRHGPDRSGAGRAEPISAPALADTMRTALAHVLINRDGPAIQPGSRAYERSWIRDGAMTSEMLLRLGHEQEAKDFLRWYAPYQFASGKVPCCVDRRGADPVPENDSNGEFLFLIEAIYRYTGDEKLLRQMWPRVVRAVDYMEKLRLSERTPQNQQGDRAAFYGLMPASISHEGYAAKPMHSYWDNFWALAGYEAAVRIARALDRREDMRRFIAWRDQFRRDVYRSLQIAMRTHDIDYLPGAAELGDFDATSTSIALSPLGEQQMLPPNALRATFERYWEQFQARREDQTWSDYTPYEWRNLAAFVRLGWRDRGLELSEYFMNDRRPAAWNQWAEVIGREPRKPRFIGDMPHGWVASDYVRSMLDMFAYERPADESLVLMAGVPSAWVRREGFAVGRLRTSYGPLTYELRVEDGRRVLSVEQLRMPVGGVVIAWPEQRAPRHQSIRRGSARWIGRELRIDALPFTIELSN